MLNSTITLGNTVEVYLNLNIPIPYYLAILFLSIETKEIKVYVHTNTSVFIGDLFVKDKTWNLNV